MEDETKHKGKHHSNKTAFSIAFFASFSAFSAFSAFFASPGDRIPPPPPGIHDGADAIQSYSHPQCCFAMCMCASPKVPGFQGGHGKVKLPPPPLCNPPFMGRNVT